MALSDWLLRTFATIISSPEVAAAMLYWKVDSFDDFVLFEHLVNDRLNLRRVFT